MASEISSASHESAELTPRAIVLGLVLAAVLGAANVYLGLKVGMTVSASIPAAVVAMLLLRRVMRGGTVLEANQVQTAASAGESLAAGILFTVPALVLIGVWARFDFWATTLIAIAGGWLGVLFMIPMRRVFIEESPELPYPEGVACASVLAAGGEDAHPDDAGAVLRGGLLGAIVKLTVSFFGILQSSIESAIAVGGVRPLFIGADLSPALLAVGYIVRLEVALQIFLGGAFGWLVVLPLAPEVVSAFASESVELVRAVSSDFEGTASERAWTLWSQGVRYIGVGAMAVGGLSALVRVRVGLMRALVELRRGWSSRAEAATTRLDLAPEYIGLFTGIAIVIVAGLYWRFTGDLGVTLLATVIMVVAAFFFVGVASYIVGLVGNSNSPVSGMTITAVLMTGGLLWIFGYTGVQGMVATLGVAAIVCCAACTAGDVCNDLKTGAIVGATPRRQQAMQLMGVVVAAFVMAPILQLLHNAYGIGSRELAAPQASLFASLARGFFGDESLPWGLVAGRLPVLAVGSRPEGAPAAVTFIEQPLDRRALVRAVSQLLSNAEPSRAWRKDFAALQLPTDRSELLLRMAASPIPASPRRYERGLGLRLSGSIPKIEGRYAPSGGVVCANMPKFTLPSASTIAVPVTGTTLDRR